MRAWCGPAPVPLLVTYCSDACVACGFAHDHSRMTAMTVVAYKLLVIAYTLLTKRELYQEPGANYLDARRIDHTVQRLRARIEQRGDTVHREPRTAAATEMAANPTICTAARLPTTYDGWHQCQAMRLVLQHLSHTQSIAPH